MRERRERKEKERKEKEEREEGKKERKEREERLEERHRKKERISSCALLRDQLWLFDTPRIIFDIGSYLLRRHESKRL